MHHICELFISGTKSALKRTDQKGIEYKHSVSKNRKIEQNRTIVQKKTIFSMVKK
jgi:hypothetical protein